METAVQVKQNISAFASLILYNVNCLVKAATQVRFFLLRYVHRISQDSEYEVHNPQIPSRRSFFLRSFVSRRFFVLFFLNHLKSENFEPELYARQHTISSIVRTEAIHVNTMSCTALSMQIALPTKSDNQSDYLQNWTDCEFLSSQISNELCIIEPFVTQGLCFCIWAVYRLLLTHQDPCELLGSASPFVHCATVFSSRCFVPHLSLSALCQAGVQSGGGPRT